MKQRFITTLCLWGTVLGSLLLLGPVAGIWLLALLSTFALKELFSALKNMGYTPLEKTGLCLGALLILAPYYFPGAENTSMGIGSTVLGLIIVILGLMLLYKPGQIIWLKNSLMPTFWAIATVPFCLHFYVAIFRFWQDDYSSSTGIALAIWVIVVAKFTDVGGFLGGYFFGKRHLAPNISPKKTWEGAVCGVAFATAIGVIFYLLAQTLMPAAFTLGKAVFIGVIISIISIPSDLFESLLKRWADLKDSGHTLPGIGGAFDLADSLLFPAPVAYALFSYLLF